MNVFGYELENSFRSHVVYRLQEMAVRSGDGFRQWLYPDVPESYEVRSDIYCVVARIEGVMTCPTANEIAKQIYREHS